MTRVPDEFLIAEEREEFLIPSSIKQAWAAQLEVLLEIDRVCKLHNIMYFADWGTYLGTVRHGGYIPWDDDLDIVMKREDYQKFLSVALPDMEEGFHVQTYENQNDFWLFMGKVVGKNRICFEKEHLQRFHNFPYIACVDIFVLDYVYRDPKKEENRCKICKYMLGVADSIVEGTMSKEEILRDLNTIQQMSNRKIPYIEDPISLGRYLYRQVEEIFAEVPECESDTLTQLFPWGLLGDGRYYPKAYYESQIWLPFEFFRMPVPVAYDTMLRKRYGEYWRVVKGAGAHDYPFFEAQKRNLQKVLDFPMPEYTYELYRKSLQTSYEKSVTLKGLTREYLDELKKQNMELQKRLFAANTQNDALQVGLQNAQQLAIELGTLIEETKGQNTEAVRMLEAYCEQIFSIFQGTQEQQNPLKMYWDQLRLVWQQCEETITCSILEKKNAVFLPVHAKNWKFFETAYQNCQESGYDVYVLPLTYFFKDYDGTPKRTINESDAFLKEIHALDNELFSAKWVEILHPEILFIQNPYDEWNEAISVEKDFYAVNLRHNTDQLIYIPPFELADFEKNQLCEYHNMKYYVTMPGVVLSDEIWLSSEQMKEMYLSKLNDFSEEKGQDAWNEKIKIVEPLYSKQEIEKTDHNTQKQSNEFDGQNGIATTKRLFYCVSLGCLAEHGELTIQKIKDNMKVYQSTPELQVIWYTYPAIDGALSETYAKLLSQYKELLHEAEKLPNVTILKDSDSICDTISYLRQIVINCSAYYGDGSPAISMFRVQKKPIMIQNYEMIRED